MVLSAPKHLRLSPKDASDVRPWPGWCAMGWKIATASNGKSTLRITEFATVVMVRRENSESLAATWMVSQHYASRFIREREDPKLHSRWLLISTTLSHANISECFAMYETKHPPLTCSQLSYQGSEHCQLCFLIWYYFPRDKKLIWSSYRRLMTEMYPRAWFELRHVTQPPRWC